MGAEGVGGDAGDEEGMAEEGGGRGEFVVVGLPGVHLEVGGWGGGGGGGGGGGWGGGGGRGTGWEMGLFV